MLYKKLNDINSREELPLNGVGNYRVVQQKVFTQALEVNFVRNCNLSCRSCSHSSPIAEKRIYEKEQLKQDLQLLSSYLQAKFLRVVGGEPLLHPELEEMLKIIKESNIANKICFVTNGLLLDRLTEESLKYIDKIEISLYPLSSSCLLKIKNNIEKLKEKNIKIRVLEYDSFRESILSSSLTNEQVIQDIYETCQIAHYLRCITVDHGRLYRCPQSMIYCEKQKDFSDSISLEEITLEKLLAFLEKNEHLQACEKCLGSVGKKFNHEQVKKENWELVLPHPEGGIDYDYMEEMKVKTYQNDCCLRKKINL